MNKKINTTEEAVRVVESTIEWLNNIEYQQGKRKLIDALPNNSGGRHDLNALITFLQENYYGKPE